jgi:hypothetical protein
LMLLSSGRSDFEPGTTTELASCPFIHSFVVVEGSSTSFSLPGFLGLRRTPRGLILPSLTGDLERGSTDVPTAAAAFFPSFPSAPGPDSAPLSPSTTK